jgi:hypothetical protein
MKQRVRYDLEQQRKNAGFYSASQFIAELLIFSFLLGVFIVELLRGFVESPGQTQTGNHLCSSQIYLAPSVKH